MFCVSSTRPLALAAALLCGLAASSTAKAADVDEGPYRPDDYYGRYERTPYPPYPAEAYEPRFLRPPAAVPEACRIRHVREVDGYGREIVRRIRICDEGVVSPHPGYDRHVYRDDPYDDPQPRAWARPPAAIGPDYDDDRD
jgi:hypothetical protein